MMTTLLSTLVLTTALTSAAMAGGPTATGPVTLTEAQMDTVTAGEKTYNQIKGVGVRQVVGPGMGGIGILPE